MIGTVQFRLTVLATAVVAVTLVVSAVGLVAVQRSLLTRGIDEALTQRADNLSADIARGRLGPELPSEGDPEDSFLQVLDRTGRVVSGTADARGMRPVVTPLAPGSRTVIRTVSGVRVGSDEFRVLARRVRASEAYTLVVAKNLDDVNESVQILTLSLSLSIPVVTALLAAMAWWLTGRALRPVESIRAEVTGIQGTEMHRRVPVPRSSDEISRLARTMNEMLDRVERATERQRQFVADASHELRSPLTRIRSELEVAITHPAPVDPAVMYRSLLGDVVQLQELVNDLLFLARSEAGSPAPPVTPVDLDDLVLEEARRLRQRGRVRVDASGVSAARTLGDRNQLGRAIGNLASNAERHASSVVRFELRECDERSELVVCDDGPGIPPEHRATVFKRFARLDEARSRDGGGVGLGLAIVADIVARHDGTIAVTAADGGGARFVMNLPRAE